MSTSYNFNAAFNDLGPNNNAISPMEISREKPRQGNWDTNSQFIQQESKDIHNNQGEGTQRLSMGQSNQKTRFQNSLGEGNDLNTSEFQQEIRQQIENLEFQRQMLQKDRERWKNV